MYLQVKNYKVNQGGRPLPNCFQNRTCKRFKSDEILIKGGGGGVRQAAAHSCVMRMFAYVSCYCKNQISVKEISSKTRERRREIAFLSPRNPKFSRVSMPPPDAPPLR